MSIGLPHRPSVVAFRKAHRTRREHQDPVAANQEAMASAPARGAGQRASVAGSAGTCRARPSVTWRLKLHRGAVQQAR